MSLIPSESYSFPDHFTKTVIPSRKPKQEKPAPEQLHKRPRIVALPDPEPVLAEEPVVEEEIMSEIWEPEVPEIKAPLPSTLNPAVIAPEMMSEIWEPEVPEVKEPPPHVPNAVLRRIQALLPRILTKPVVDPEINPEPWEPEVPEVKAPPPDPMPKPNPAVRRAHSPPPRVREAPVRKIALPPTLKPKVRWNNRAPATDPSGNHNNSHGNGNGNGATGIPTVPLPPALNVIPMKPRPAPGNVSPPRPPQPVAPRQVMPQSIVPRPPQPVAPRQVMPQPVVPRPPQPVAPRQVIPHAPVSPQLPRKPVPAPVQMRPVQPRPISAPPQPTSRKPAPPLVPTAQADFLEMFAENGYDAANRRRRELKFRRFVACEGAILLVLLPLVILGLTLNITAPALRWIMNILTIAAAVSAVVTPIIFYAANPTLPEVER